MQEIWVVPYRLWGFQDSRKYHTWGIGIGSSPIRYEGFVKPRKGQGEARLNYSIYYIRITIILLTSTKYWWLMLENAGFAPADGFNANLSSRSWCWFNSCSIVKWPWRINLYIVFYYGFTVQWSRHTTPYKKQTTRVLSYGHKDLVGYNKSSGCGCGRVCFSLWIFRMIQ